ncbi:glycosyltransferase family 1 protein [Zopfia rhizophila CBS 207.26]|uniref:UDP-N-acetylglucosamine transferase subunit ALG13 n=1 Tax=Zopfia rhizophila CBS 207.26 TaxID=1314779 RepID=A0A6A6EQ96_9PEZI|nr:glycosyltransferase family 1 protein [Zopfia rhizophila CBS 207.26]
MDEEKAKVCFVTTGATAPFTDLIKAVFKTEAVDALQKAGYTHMLVQYGTAKDVFEQSSLNALRHMDGNTPRKPIRIEGIDFKQGLKDEFKLARTSNGLVISHAGSGSILEALRYDVPLIVVPNDRLLHNHQAELAKAMAASNYLLEGNTDNLAPSIAYSESFKMKKAQFPPITSGKHRETEGLEAIMDAELGFQD